MIVVFLYGSMVWGIVPEEFLPKFYTQKSSPISWESHLAGGVVGLIFAILTKNYGVQKKKYSWEENNQPDAREKWLWNAYKETLTEEEKISIEQKYGEVDNEK